MSSLCFLPFYWVAKIKINKISLTAYWIAIISAFVFKYQFFTLLQRIIGYEQYQDYEGARAGSFMILLMMLSAFVTLFYKKMFKYDDFFGQISINALFVACVFSSLLLINQSCMRVVQYFSFFIMFILPECKYAFKEGKSRSLFFVICCAVMIFLMANHNMNYVFFWQE